MDQPDGYKAVHNPCQVIKMAAVAGKSPIKMEDDGKRHQEGDYPHKTPHAVGLFAEPCIHAADPERYHTGRCQQEPPDIDMDLGHIYDGSDPDQQCSYEHIFKVLV